MTHNRAYIAPTYVGAFSSLPYSIDPPLLAFDRVPAGCILRLVSDDSSLPHYAPARQNAGRSRRAATDEIGDPQSFLRINSGSLAKFAATRRASSLLSHLSSAHRRGSSS